MRERAKRYGINVARSLTLDATSKDALDKELNSENFDFVFVDCPCSGLGTLRRHPELKWRLTNKKINHLASLSFNILSNAAARVSQGGVLVFSTCTVTKAENEEVVERFLKSPLGQDFKLNTFNYEGKELPYFRTLTVSGLNDAHFCVAFTRFGKNAQ